MEELSPTDPRRVGRYELRGRLGSGGMGSVYLGESPGRRKVAVKVVHAHLVAADASFRERFRAEVAAARKVGGFYTAAIVDSDADAAMPWYASAYFDAPTLAEVVRKGGPLSPSAVVDLGAGLAEALSAIHDEDLVHRDLKPQNVIVSPDGPRVIDFGIAKVMSGGPRLTGTGSVVGTSGYLAPELLRGESATPASDVFALGVLLVFAAAGVAPFHDRTPAAEFHRTLNDQPTLTGVDPELRAVLARCLDKDPVRRPDLDALLQAFNGVPAQPSAPEERSPAPPARVPTRQITAMPAHPPPDRAPPPRPRPARPAAGRTEWRADPPPMDEPGNRDVQLIGAPTGARVLASLTFGVPPALLLLWAGAAPGWSVVLALALAVPAGAAFAFNAREIDAHRTSAVGGNEALTAILVVSAVTLYLSIHTSALAWWWHVAILAAVLIVGFVHAIIVSVLLEVPYASIPTAISVDLITSSVLLAPTSAAVAVLLLDQGVGMPLWAAVPLAAVLGAAIAITIGLLVRPRVVTL